MTKTQISFGLKKKKKFKHLDHPKGKVTVWKKKKEKVRSRPWQCQKSHAPSHAKSKSEVKIIT